MFQFFDLTYRICWREKVITEKWEQLRRRRSQSAQKISAICQVNKPNCFCAQLFFISITFFSFLFQVRIYTTLLFIKGNNNLVLLLILKLKLTNIFLVPNQDFLIMWLDERNQNRFNFNSYIFSESWLRPLKCKM